MTDRRYIGDTSFAVTARVAMQLGRESISSSVVALLELVKNSYDADAENVWVKFYGLGTAHSTLIIEDDGVGMDRGGLERDWMVIGTDAKRKRARSSGKKRTLTGEKGLGRLGLDRLCHLTTIRTLTATTNNGIELEIDWTRYENTNQRLEQITHRVFEIPRSNVHSISRKGHLMEHGTILVLTGLKDDWTDERLAALHQELSLLVSPFREADDFAVYFDTGLNLPELNGRVRSGESLTAAEWQLRSEIFEDSGNFYVKHEMLSPAHQASFTAGPDPWTKLFPDSGSDRPRCGSLRFEFFFFERFPDEAASLTASQVASFLKANQGIRIYRDGFRVRPYGDPSGQGDWLGLSLRRTQSPGGVRKGKPGTWRVGYNQIVGAVFIGREPNPALIDQTNREGIVDGPAYWDLRKFALDGITFFERQRQSFEIARIGVDSFERARDNAEHAAQASADAVERLRSMIDQAVEVLTEKEIAPGLEQSQVVLRRMTEIADILEKTTIESYQAQATLARVSEDQQEELQRQKDTLGNLASLGILAAAFGHETLAAANLVYNNAQLLSDNISELLFPQPDVHQRILENVEDIASGAEKVETFAKFTLANVSRDKRNRVKLDLAEVCQDVLASFAKALATERGIRVEFQVQSDLPPILGFRIDWESIIVNLIVNAVWAMENTSRDERQIRIRIFADSDTMHFQFCDSGRGVQSGTEELIFLPTYSTKTNERGDVIGTGMGLAIIKNLVETNHGGVVEVKSSSCLGGAEFCIQLPIPRLADRGGRK